MLMLTLMSYVKNVWFNLNLILNNGKVGNKPQNIFLYIYLSIQVLKKLFWNNFAIRIDYFIFLAIDDI